MENKKAKRIWMALAGVALTGLAVTLIQLAALGADPFTCLCTGLSFLFDTTYGVVFTALSTLLLCTSLRCSRKLIGLATFFSLFGIGWMVDLLTQWMTPLLGAPGLCERVGMMLAGIVLLCFAASLYYTARLGVSPYDAVALTLTAQQKFPFQYCRMGTDLICVGGGFYLDAAIGVGTVITAFFMGPMINYFNRIFSEPFLRRNAALRRQPA